MTQTFWFWFGEDVTGLLRDRTVEEKAFGGGHRDVKYDRVVTLRGVAIDLNSSQLTFTSFITCDCCGLKQIFERGRYNHGGNERVEYRELAIPMLSVSVGNISTSNGRVELQVCRSCLVGRLSAALKAHANDTTTWHHQDAVNLLKQLGTRPEDEEIVLGRIRRPCAAGEST